MLYRFSNILEYSAFSEASLETLMNGPVKEALELKKQHGGQSSTVFSKLQGDFMKPVIDIGIHCPNCSPSKY